MQAELNLIHAFGKNVNYLKVIVDETIDQMKVFEEKDCDISEHEVKLEKLDQRVAILAAQIERELEKMRKPYSI